MFAVAVLVTAVFALPPAAHATRPSLSLGSYRLRDALVAGQVAVCVMLVVTSGVLVHHGHRQAALDLGYDARNVFAAAFESSPDAAALRAMLEQAPWVESVAFMAAPPTSLPTLRIGPSASSLDHTYINFVSPAYFHALRIPIVAGRTFTEQEAR
jgi:hypothetical protein